MNDIDKILKKNEIIYGQEAMKVLKETCVVVFGLGGVGSYCATSLARAGIGNLTIVDYDVVEFSNINRQEFAYISSLGSKKTSIAKKIITDINPHIKLNVFDVRADRTNIDTICQDAGYVIDCVDDVSAKIEIAKHCQLNNVNHIACMGTAQRIDPLLLKIGKIYNTEICPLCKKVRHEARAAGLNDFNVVYSGEKPIAGAKELGSSPFVPSVAGFILSSFVVNSLVA